MRYIRSEADDPTAIKNAQVLGDQSPLEFDDQGRAGPLEDDLAERVVAMDAHLTLGRPVRDGDDETDSDADVDAEAFVDRTPMEDVVADIDSGEYDAHLDAIEAAATREGVQDAIDERRQ